MKKTLFIILSVAGLTNNSFSNMTDFVDYSVTENNKAAEILHASYCKLVHKAIDAAWKTFGSKILSTVNPKIDNEKFCDDCATGADDTPKVCVLLGISAAILSAILLNKTIYKGNLEPNTTQNNT